MTEPRIELIALDGVEGLDDAAAMVCGIDGCYTPETAEEPDLRPAAEQGPPRSAPA